MKKWQRKPAKAINVARLTSPPEKSLAEELSLTSMLALSSYGASPVKLAS